MDSICLNKNVLTLKHVLEIVSTSFYSLNLRKCVNIREVSAMYNLSDMSILRNVRDITIVRGDVVDISALGNVHSLARYSIAKISRTCRRSETSTMIGCGKRHGRVDAGRGGCSDTVSLYVQWVSLTFRRCLKTIL